MHEHCRGWGDEWGKGEAAAFGGVGREWARRLIDRRPGRLGPGLKEKGEEEYGPDAETLATRMTSLQKHGDGADAERHLGHAGRPPSQLGGVSGLQALPGFARFQTVTTMRLL